MSYKLGNFVFVNMDTISSDSMCIMDLGLETRDSTDYYFDNETRGFTGYAFQYTLDGVGIYETEKGCYKITPGKAFLMSFPEKSKYYYPREDSDHNKWTYFYIHFKGPAVEPLFKKILDISGHVVELPIDSLPIVHFFELYNTLHIQKQLERYVGSQWLYNFLISLLRTLENPDDSSLSPYVSEAVNWMHFNYSKPVNLEDMSEGFGVCYEHFSRQFLKEEGIPPVQYMTQLRLTHATRLLTSSTQSVKEIAAQCGFSSSNYFTKVFKNKMNLTPSEYRKLHT